MHNIPTEWDEWYRNRGSKQYTKAGKKYSRLRKATQADVNQWFADATARLIASESAIRASSRHSGEHTASDATASTVLGEAGGDGWLAGMHSHSRSAQQAQGGLRWQQVRVPCDAEAEEDGRCGGRGESASKEAAEAGEHCEA
jgi:hypothetical protein